MDLEVIMSEFRSEVNLKVKFVRVCKWFDWCDKLKKIIEIKDRLPYYPLCKK